MDEIYAGTVPVQKKHHVDLQALARYMRDHVEGFSGELEIAQFKGGQSNPTYLLSTRKERYVLRRKPSGQLLPSAHAIDREYRVLHALCDSEVPVAKTYCMCEDDSIVGSSFYIMEYVEGRIFWDQSLPGLDRNGRAAIYEELNRIIANVHSLDPAIVGLEDFGRTGKYVERQIARWTRQYRASQTENLADMEQLITWLPQNIPLDDQSSIVHGDYRIDNLIFHPTEPRALAVLDWELSTLGHPLADFAYHCLSWHIAPDLMRGLAGLDLGALGIPEEQAYLDMYCKRTDRAAVPAAEWNFYLAYNLFRIAAILQGVKKRGLDGNASNENALRAGERAQQIAELGRRRLEAIQTPVLQRQQEA